MSPTTLVAIMAAVFIVALVPMVVWPTKPTDEDIEPNLLARPYKGNQPATCNQGHVHTNAAWARECNHEAAKRIEERKNHADPQG